MPRIDLDLRGLDAARKELQEQTARQRALDLDIATAQAALDKARRAGESRDTISVLERRLTDAKQSRAGAVAQQRATRTRIDALADGLLRERDPSSLVEALDAKHPIALLPVRLETRYVPRRSAVESAHPHLSGRSQHDRARAGVDAGRAEGRCRLLDRALRPSGRRGRADPARSRNGVRPRARGVDRPRAHARQSRSRSGRRGRRSGLSRDRHDRLAREGHARGAAARSLVRDRLRGGPSGSLPRVGQSRP